MGEVITQIWQIDDTYHALYQVHINTYYVILKIQSSLSSIIGHYYYHLCDQCFVNIDMTPNMTVFVLFYSMKIKWNFVNTHQNLLDPKIPQIISKIRGQKLSTNYSFIIIYNYIQFLLVSFDLLIKAPTDLSEMRCTDMVSPNIRRPIVHSVFSACTA